MPRRHLLLALAPAGLFATVLLVVLAFALERADAQGDADNAPAAPVAPDLAERVAALEAKARTARGERGALIALLAWSHERTARHHAPDALDGLQAVLYLDLARRFSGLPSADRTQIAAGFKTWAQDIDRALTYNLSATTTREGVRAVIASATRPGDWAQSARRVDGRYRWRVAAGRPAGLDAAMRAVEQQILTEADATKRAAWRRLLAATIKGAIRGALSTGTLGGAAAGAAGGAARELANPRDGDD